MDELHEEHLDPTTEISLETVKKRSVKGVITLTGRAFFLQALAAVATGFLAAYLGASEWGLFAILNAVINFLNYFSDIGLAAALVQKKEHPSDADLKTTFLVQQVLVLIVICVVVLLTPTITRQYSLNNDGVMLLYALIFSFLLSSFKSIPSVLLERKLEFVKLALPQILEQVIYYVVLVVLAIGGQGIKAFTVAVLARSILGAILIYAIQPWRPGIAFSKKALSGLFRFGVPYQFNTFLAALKDDGITLVLGGVLGLAGVGYLNVALKFARYPLTFFMDTVTKVTFPAFSRLRDSRDDLERSLTRSIFFTCFLVFPSLVGLVILAPIIVKIIPRYQQWEPALLALVLVSINFGFAAVTTQLTNLLNAIGKIKITSFLMVMWVVLSWALIPFLAAKFGVNGAALGYALVGASSVIAIYIARKYVKFSLSEAVYKPATAAGLMGVIIFILRGILPVSFYSLSLLIIIGIVTYGVIMVAMIGASLIQDAKRSVRAIFTSK